MNKTTIPIKGMHCRSCEILIEDKLKELAGAKSVSISYKSGAAVIFSKQPIGHEAIRQKIEEAGYQVGVDAPKEWINTNPQIYTDLSVGLVVLLILYYLFSQFGLFNLSVGSLSNPSGLGVVLLIGLTAGFSSCMALVGGLILGVSARHSEKHPEATVIQKFRPHLFFNLGRIASYFLLGGLIGLVGKAFQLSGTTLGVLTILVGLVMLTVGLQLTELSPRLAGIKLTFPSSVSKFFGMKEHQDREYSHFNSALVGALTFFLPCGFTQAMQLYAMSTGSFIRGALIMGIFAIGTAPGLLGVGGLTSVIKGVFARRFFKFAGIVVIILAIFNLSNGFNLTGISAKFPTSSPKASNQADLNVTEEGGFQIVRMTQDSNGYHPNNFTIKNGIPVKWVVTSTSAGSCATSLSAPQVNISQFLKLGENDFEFMPKETGIISFSCSMGMYRGAFNVVD
jgi:sulfite exporter TauE/SafE/copper chaperone CopZ